MNIVIPSYVAGPLFLIILFALCFAAAVLKIRLREGGAFAFVPHPFAAPLPPMNICACGRVFARRAHRNIFVLVLGIFSAFIGLCRFPSRQGERRVRRTFKPPSF